jgi:hypothetical protein
VNRSNAAHDRLEAFDAWLCQAPAECVAAAVRAALGPPSDRLSTLLDLPMLDDCGGAPTGTDVERVPQILDQRCTGSALCGIRPGAEQRLHSDQVSGHRAVQLFPTLRTWPIPGPRDVLGGIH